MKTTHNPVTAENRGSPRVSVPPSTMVNDAHSGRNIGQLVNLSSEGLMIVSSERLAPGTVCQLLIRSGTADNGDPRELKFGAESLWSEDANESGAHWTGMQIIDISPQQQALLDEMIS